MNKKRKNFKGVTLVELLITIALLSIFMPYALSFLRTFPKDIAISQTYVDTQESISDFVQNFQNLIIMSWEAEFRKNGNNADDGNEYSAANAITINDYSNVATFSDRDIVFFRQLPDKMYDAGVSKLLGWCKVEVESMSVSGANPLNLFQIRWTQSVEPNIDANGNVTGGRLGNGDTSFVIIDQIKRVDYNLETDTPGVKPIFKLIPSDPKNPGAGASGIFVQCLVAIKSFDSSQAVEYVKMEFASYFQNV